MRDLTEEHMQRLNIHLPKPNNPLNGYVSVKQVGRLLYTAGQDCRINGELQYEGKLGEELTIEEGKHAAEIVMLNLLAAIKQHTGSLDSIKQVVKILAFVNSTNTFADQPHVIDGASDLLNRILKERGTHARSAVSANSLPFHTPVEIEMIVELK
ncbi:RidA family protein [Alkalicoccobacillus murimartini]|uniref:Enamine deaminase RidA (YjgF/YER057c/UK114 family) n=1 Tax=Alkalicoccobacillus murimartini TaxID=171685 RepID=A0ABT9YIC6_9BACI|nr:RidA family protein [Alkalicoccobacillus murimartini]MDQ0207358.1 enamine deaminase RidA (YjgF/YER057c/UK114 family) [Alkalicoccobacillus murimartini]